MITMFRNHWISRRIVEKPAQDMTKAWPVINSAKLKPDDIANFDRVIARTHTPSRIREAIKWARLFGGAGALIVIDGHEAILNKPLRLDDVNPGAYKGLIVFDRWSGITPSAEIVDDINSPIDYNMPVSYRVQGESGVAFEIHHSRILRFCGPEVPRPENQNQMHWGISELEIAYEEIRKRDNSSWAILSLLFRAQLLAQKNPQLANMLAGIGASGEAAKKFQQTMDAQNKLMSNQSMLLMGADSELQSHQYTFGGISDVYQQFQMDIAGAARIPVSILFGRTMSGLGQNNDSDIRIYEQEIAQKQHEELKPQLDKLYPVICMSEFGEVPDDLDFDFPSIRVLTEEQKGDIADKVVEAVSSLYTSGLISQQLALMEIKAQSDITGIGTNITPEIIEAADSEAQPMMNNEMSEASEGEEDADRGGAKDAAPLVNYTASKMPITIETRKGKMRFGKGFATVMPADYGFIEGTEGADGDEIDCYVHRNRDSKTVFVINQSKIGAPSEFDEHKCMIGYDNHGDAVRDYFKGHQVAHEIFMSIVPMELKKFKKWIATPQRDFLNE